MTDIHGLKPDVWPNTPYNVTAQIRGDIRQIVQREIEQVTIGTIGAETPAGAQAKVNASAQSLTAAIAAAKAELALVDATKAALIHTHDDRYYLKSQVDAALSGKAAAVHTHHDLYYVKSEIDALLVGTGAVHNHNDLYYLKSEISAFLSAKAPVVHHHDDRYFTESEVTSLLAGKAAAVHSHNDLYYTEAEVDALIEGVSSGAGWTPVNATTTTKGIVELATTTETTTGLDGTRATTPAGVKAALDAKTVSDTSTYAALNHAARHATGQPDAITPASIGAQPAGSYAPALGADDNYVTDAEKAALHSHSNKTALDAVSGTNTGDATGIAVELTAVGWSANSQTVTATGVTASSLLVVAPTPADQVDYVAAGVICTTQDTDSLTFTCTTTPTTALDIQVVIL